MKIRTIKCSFTNSRGYLLDARIDAPADNDNAPSRFIIFCHCFTCNKETLTTFRLSRLLAASGYTVLRFDFTGLGGSEGDFSTTTFSSTQDDLRSAIAFLKNRYHAPAFLMGHSLGGTTALSVAQEFDFVKGVVTVASPCEPEHVLHHFGHALTLLEQGSPASFEVAGAFYDITPEFVDNVRSADMKQRLANLKKPVLIFNVKDDALVSAADSRQIQDWSAGETTLIDVIGSNHLLSNREATEGVAHDIVQWMQNIQ
ncbi:MAG: alpha/beta fold hydrolase [Gammaproteobacteria bacterium]|nr:alpha/beta fold hydrolase [Gammaproteobacteria bacterium]